MYTRFYFQDMTYPEYVDALCLVAFVAYAKPRFNREYAEPAEKIDSLLKYCGFRKSSGDNQLTQDDTSAESMEATDELQKMVFPEGEIAGNFSLSLMSECVIPPENCPPEVGALLEQAFDNHNLSNFEAAINLYNQAKDDWEGLQERPSCGKKGVLPLEHNLYFTVAVGSVLQSDGQDRKALELYQQFETEVPEQIYPLLRQLHIFFFYLRFEQRKSNCNCVQIRENCT